MKDEEENKLSNAIITLHLEIKGLRQDMDRQLGKVNLGLQEMRLSYMKLDESFNARIGKLDESINGMRSDFNKYAQRNDDKVTNHETRIARLEPRVLGSGSSFVAEPKAHYGKRKKK